MASVLPWAPSGVANTGKGPVNGAGGETGYRNVAADTGSPYSVTARDWQAGPGTFHGPAQQVAVSTSSTGTYAHTATKNPNTQT